MIDEFLQLWKAADSSPDVFAFLNDRPDSKASDVLALLVQDQQHRWKTDIPWKVEDYLSKLPELASDPDCKFQLAVGEFQARQDGDTLPSIDEFTSRFSDISEQLRSKLSELASEAGKNYHDCTTETYITDSPRGALIGRYRLVRVLGEGAFGRVFLGFDEELQRQVAIKVPTEERFQKPEDAQQYLDEARKVASLDHPNIVPVYDTGRTEDGSIYVVSKYIEGGTLSEWIKGDRPNHDECARLLASVALGLHHAHEKRLIHRDVKPANILLEGGTAYVADFGLAVREEDYLKGGKIAGTPAYMSPEQVRGEGHRLDGRSDIFSLGVVLYEALTGKTPFRGSTSNELFHQVISVQPKPPRELDGSIPAELERICMKSLSKRASDRYATAADLADDLLSWNQTPQQEHIALQIVPKGLRSFDVDDADFFLDLLPGPRNRHGLPESIQFWKTRMEETDPDHAFSVGLIYGPSGCGKSSLMKAGLLPRLSKDVVAVYIEATPDETETRILRGLRKQFPELPADSGLADTFTLLRRAEGRKVVIVLDQFEQWLHAHRAEQETELVAALRQCDGGRLQAVVMVRDDFSMAAARFMDSLDIPILQGHNFATVDLFDVDHAEKVLVKFGQAFGKLPAQTDIISDDERAFVTAVASGLAQDGKVVSVRLALFAEMVKGKPWVPGTLDEVGGTDGIGINFLEETFSSRSANPKHRLHQQAAREVLNALLPEVGSDIKGHMRSHGELLEASGYQSRPGEFNDLLRILDGELRLITPTDPEGFQTKSGSDPGSKYYQLTHDYLVPSLRDWLTRKQKETRKGRAELKLAERSALWSAKPENRYLPSLVEWAGIRAVTQSNKWTEPQKVMMGKVTRLHAVRSLFAAALVLAITLAGIGINNAATERRNDEVAAGRVEGLLQADTSQIKAMITSLDGYRKWAADDLGAAFAQPPAGMPNAKLHAALAMLPEDDSVLEYLKDQLLIVSPMQFQYVRDLMVDHKSSCTEEFWLIANDGQQDPAKRFQAACALATYDPESESWNKGDLCQFIANHLVRVGPSELAPWRDTLRGVQTRLVGPLAEIFRDDSAGEQVRSFATDTLADYSKDEPELLTGLLIDSDTEAFGTLFPVLQRHDQVAVNHLKAVLDRQLEPAWNDAPFDPGWTAPGANVKAAIESAHGMIGERFAFCQDLPWEEFSELAETLAKSGYRPTRVRPWRESLFAEKESSVRGANSDEPATCVAAVWTRDGKRWELETDLAQEQLPDPESPAERGGLVPEDLAVLSPGDGSDKNRFVVLWNEPDNADEQRRLLADVPHQQLTSSRSRSGFYYSPLAKQGFASQLAVAVWTDDEGNRHYGGIWSNHGAPSELNPAYAGFELVDQPQWDVAVAAASKLADPLGRFRRLLTIINGLPDNRVDEPRVRLDRARARFRLGEYEAALEDLDFLVEKQEAVTGEVLYLRAWTLAGLKKQDEAHAALEKFIENADDSPPQGYVEIVTAAWLGEHDEADAKLDALVTAAGQDSGRLYDAACATALAALPFGESDPAQHGKYVDRAIELLASAVTHGYSDVGHLGSDADLVALHSEARFTTLLNQLEPPGRYAAVWRADVEFESKLVTIPMDGSLTEIQSLVDQQGYRPVAIAVAASAKTPGTSVTQCVFHRPIIPDEGKERLAVQQATAATALLRMGQPDPVWPLLQHHPDPRLRSYLLHRLASYGADPAKLIARLGTEAEVSRRRALILAIGEFARGELLTKDQMISTTTMLAKSHADDPDPGIHGASEWTLRQLGAESEITQVRDAYAKGAVVGERQWYLTKTGRQTFAILDSQDEFLMGSPVTEAERFGGPTGKNEIRHRRRIGRRFALGTHEVTVAQFQQFREDHRFDRTRARELNAPANLLTWYDAAAFCNWLSAQEGISRDDWCYDPDQKFAEGMTLVTDYLQRTGYRLPTEAEWEYACRAASTTTRYFGETEELLGQYAWYTENSGDKWMLPVGSLKPNDNGLFDMQGNVMEWCQDRVLFYEKGSEDMSDSGEIGKISDSGSRVLRGGSFSSYASYVRSASRTANRPDNRSVSIGFRVARTYP